MSPAAHVASATTTRRPAAALRPDEVLAGLAVGAVVLVLWPVYNALRGLGPLRPAVVVAHVAGMLAGYGVGGRLVVGLVLLHAWAATVGWADSRGESTWLALWHLLELPGLIAATLAAAVLLAVAVLSVRAARRQVSCEVWHAVHLLVHVGVALSSTHQLAGPDLAGRPVLQVLWALLYTGLFALVLVHRVLTPLRNARRHSLRVASVQAEGPGVVSIVVEGEHLHELEAESGQFFRWRFLTPDLCLTAHPFSLSAAPDGRQLRLTVKTLGDGSSRLQQLEPGPWVLAEGPYGALTAERRTRRDVLLLAGGVGITSVRALFETMPLEPDQDLLLLCRARSEADVLFRAELEELAQRRGGRVRYLLGDDVGPLTPELLTRLVPGLPDRDVYLCGPPGLAAALRRALRGAGLPDAQLHEERFAL